MDIDTGDMEARVFQRKRPDFSKFKPYGMQETESGHHFETDFMDGAFLALIDIDCKGKVSGTVIDKMNDEEYAPLRSCSYGGAYVSAVRKAYEEVLADIAGACYEDVFFKSEQANRITQRIYDKYGDRPDFPWEKRSSYETSGTFRHRDTSKWYGLIMNVRESVLDRSADNREVDILNLKINERDGESLRREDGIYPAWHMNHRLWISVVLDETLDDERVMELVDVSYRLTGKRGTDIKHKYM